MAGGRCSSHPLKIFRVLLVLEIMTAVGLVPDDVVSLTGRFRLVLAQGSWEVLVQNAGISSMHTAVTHFGNVVLLDRTNIGPSQLPLNGGRCRANPADRVSTKDIFPLACCDHRFFCFFFFFFFSIFQKFRKISRIYSRTKGSPKKHLVKKEGQKHFPKKTTGSITEIAGA
jgi:hypothetical protein